jgi:hypothetical protein
MDSTYCLVTLELGLQVVLVDIRLLVPHIVLCGLVDLRKVLLCRADLVCGLLRSIGGNVLSESRSVAHCVLSDTNPMGIFIPGPLTELAELSIGDHECSESLQTLCSLGGILLASLLIDGEVRTLSIAGGKLLGLPDEVLEKFTLILHQEHLLSRVDNIAQV